MNLKEAAARSGLSVYTIRFYQKADMLPRILRDTRDGEASGPSPPNGCATWKGCGAQECH